MLTLALLACLANDPTDCSRTVVVRQPVTGGMNCDLLAAQHLDPWAAANPDRVVQRHWCTLSRVRTPQIYAQTGCTLSAQTAMLRARQNPGASAFADCVE